MMMSIKDNTKRLAGLIVGILLSLQAQSQMVRLISSQAHVDSIRWINNNSRFIETLKIVGDEIDNLDSLVFIEKVNHLEVIDSDLRSLHGLNKIKSLSSLTLKNNEFLEDISHFDSLKILNGYNIIDCPLISKIDVMPLLKSNYISLSIEGNTRSLKVIDGFENSTIGGLYVLNNTGVQYIYGGDNFILESFQVSGNKSLKEIVGINGDNTVCGDTINWDQSFGLIFSCFQNDSLELIDALHGVHCFAQTSIYANPLLKQIKIGYYTAYVDYISISICPSLISIEGYNNLKKVTNNASVIVGPCENLSELKIVNNYSGKFGYVDLGYLWSLHKVESFDQLTEINELSVIDCDTLFDLYFFAKLKRINNELKLFWNNRLKICNIPAVCEFLPKANPDYIFDNAHDCNSIEEIDIKCHSSVVDFYKCKFLIYPNPAIDFIKIRSEKEQNVYHIFDIVGKHIIIKHLNSNGILDISELQSGTYFIKSEGGNTQRFVKI